jgi:hypothetical protein
MAANIAIQPPLKCLALFPVTRRQVVNSFTEIETQSNMGLALVAFLTMLVIVSSMLAFLKFS